MVLKWRHHGDLWEALVSHETADGRVLTKWVTALRMLPVGLSTEDATVATRVSDDQELTALAIEQAFDAYGQYHEEVASGDRERVEQLGRIGSAIAKERGGTVGAGAVPKGDGRLQVCLWLTTELDPI